MSHAIKFLEQSYYKQRLSHLYLLVGPKGSGKYQAAKHAAHLLLSDGKLDEHTLDQINRNEHVNFFFLTRDGQNIKKQQILDLQEEFSKTSLQKGARIYIIADIETLSASAANSLLKFMEEPESSNTYGFLLTSNIEQILPTIISRSQVVKMPLVDEGIVIGQLINEGISENIVYNLVKITKDFDEALKLSQDESYNGLITLWSQLVNNFGNKDFILSVEIDKYRGLFNSQRSYFKDFLELFLVYVTDLMRALTNNKLYYTYLNTQINNQANNMSVEKLKNIINKIYELIKNNNANVNIDLSIDIFILAILPFY